MSDPLRTRAREILTQAARLVGDERSEFIDAAYADQPELRREVESLLASSEPCETPIRTRTIGPYRVIRELGRGGMGVVYLGHDDKLDRPVAIKRLLRDGRPEPDAVDRIRREARVLASLNHPNIATVYSLEADAEGPFLTMEWIDGPTLASALRQGPLDLRRAVHIGRAIAAALEGAHELGVVHRDLKPCNIMMMRGTAKVLDFGLAHGGARDLLEDPDATLDSVPPLAGTPGYMSPEQIRGLGADASADIWALGCCLFESLTASPAFPGRNATDRMRATLEIDPPWERLPKVPDAVRSVLESCLARDFERRPRTATEVRLQLDSVLDGRPTEVALSTRSRRTTVGVPAPSVPIRGRGPEIAKIRDTLRTSRAVTVTGFGGCGKTRLAVEVARFSGSDFPGGVWYVQLGQLPGPQELIPHLCSELGLTEEPSIQPLERLQQYVGDQRVLIVLDEAESSLDEVADRVEEILHLCPSTSLLITSREPLEISGEYVFPLGPLPVPSLEDTSGSEQAAVEVFLDRARTYLPGYDPTPEERAQVRAVCQALEGVPLALELAASRLEVLSLGEVAEQLSRALALLRNPSRRAVSRHRTMRTALEWSYGQLTCEDQLVFRRMSAFPGAWSLEDAEQACVDEIPRWDVLDRVQRLRRLSLIVEESPGGTGGRRRHRMLRIVRDLGQELLVEGNESENARDRFLSVQSLRSASMLEAADGRPSPAPIDEILANETNMVYALELGAEPRIENDVVLPIAVALGRAWMERSRWRTARRYLERVLERLDDPSGSPLLPDLLDQLGACAWWEGHYEDAKQYHDRARKISHDSGDTEREARAHFNLARVHFRIGDHDRARADLSAAKDLWTSAGSFRGAIRLPRLSGSWTRSGIVRAWSTYYRTSHRFSSEFESSIELRRSSPRWRAAPRSIRTSSRDRRRSGRKRKSSSGARIPTVNSHASRHLDPRSISRPPSGSRSNPIPRSSPGWGLAWRPSSRLGTSNCVLFLRPSKDT